MDEPFECGRDTCFGIYRHCPARARDAEIAGLRSELSAAAACEAELTEQVRELTRREESLRAELVQTSKMLAEASEHWDKSMDAWEKAKAAARQDAEEKARLREALTEADGCFEAALCEGWIDALENGEIDRVRDVWSRRIAYARAYIQAALACRPQGEKS